MLDPDPPFQPIRRAGGYLPLEDHGLIGDGAAAALVGRDGAVSWMCLPRFDSRPVFCGLLDHARGGAFTFAPDEPFETRQLYRPDTAVLDTEFRCASGTVRITDVMTLRAGADLSDDVPAGRGELVRTALVLSGRVRLRYAIEPLGGAQARPLFSGVELRLPERPGMRLHLRGDRPLGGVGTGEPDGTHGVYELEQGESVSLCLSWARAHRHHRFEAETTVRSTERAWRRWMSGFDYQGPQESMVRRSAVTLKLCDDWTNGSLVAAPTSSLPAPIGGVRNWDYRYAWVRDAAFAVFALRRIGFGGEADAFLGWVLDAFEAGEGPRIMYTLTGEPVPDEVVDHDLEGYRGSAPVRWGNGATDQVQHDVYGEVLDCAYQWVEGGGDVPPHLWQSLARLAGQAGEQWRTPDQGIWEVRSAGRVFTYSAAMCQVAMDRAGRIARLLGDREAARHWRQEAESLRDLILNEAWDERARTLTEHLGDGGGLDASLLALPLRRVVPFDHPRMTATTAAVAERLSAGGGLLYRYLHTDSPDGLPGDEGAFLLCSFWLVDNLSGQGRLEEAEELYTSLCARASPLGLLSEQIDPGTGAFCGNFPQAFSHIGVIASGSRLGRALSARR
ncbi:glycoside hydrolase family 15 protein [Actinospica robiniae]|uniref:glycoside hydrolase family 15 protein n=1 Tax=Actinospica robiniae TaxID=304901 RepID=UPI00041EDD7C|nr:glycoside hydrolase family 15 protein [Actinospica robiniae]